ncbi:RHS repeat-associated core domain-containing protein [Arthrobacter russicus]
MGGNWRGSYGQDIGVAYSADRNQVTFRDTSGFNQVFTKNADGSWKSPVGLKATLATPADGTMQVTYNSSGQKLTFSPGGFIVSDVDRNGIGTTYAYTGTQLASITDAAGRVSTVTKTGAETTVKLPDSRVVYYKRDDAGRLIQTGVKSNPAPATKLAISNEFSYGSNGKVASATLNRANSSYGTVGGVKVTYNFAYDEAGRAASVTLRSEGADQNAPKVYAERVTKFAYNDTNTVVTDPAGKNSTVNLDAQGRQISSVDQLGRTRSQDWTANSDIQSVTSGSATGGPAGDVTKYEYDSLGNQSGVSLPTGAAASAAYAQNADCNNGGSGNAYQVKCATDAQSNKSTFAYDGQNNMISAKDETTGGQKFQITREKADRSVSGAFAGMTCSSTDANGKVTTFGYNTNGDLTKVTPPAPLKPTTYTYDSVSRPKTVTDPRGTKVTYNYNATDALFYTNQPSADGNTANASLGFDGLDLDSSNRYNYSDSTYPSPTGRGATEQRFTRFNIFGDPQGPRIYRYNSQPDLDKSATPDANGNLADFWGNYGEGGYDYLGGYGRDAANQLTNAGTASSRSCTAASPAPAGSDCIAYEYNSAGSVTSQVFPGGAKKTTTYDISQRPTRSTVKDATGAVVYDVGYVFKDVAGTDRGLLQTKTSYVEEGVAAGAVSTYAYDSKNQLINATEQTGATVSASWAYEYDPAGNRIKTVTTGASGSPAETKTYSFNDANQITASSAKPSGWIYDEAGNMTANPESSTQFACNTRNGARNITKNGTETKYQYMGQGNTNRGENGTVKEYQTQLGLEMTVDGNEKTTYFRDPNGNILSKNTGSTRIYYVTDAQGSVIALLDSAGKKVGGYSYDPYGVGRTVTPGAAETNTLRYIGGIYDSATGLYKLGARYYDPALGRFTQQDPSGQEANPYTYAVNNPINNSDPSGLLTAGSAVGFGIGFAFTAVITGAFCAATLGGCGFVAAAAIGAVAGGVGGFTGGAVAAKIDGGDVRTGAFTGGLFGAYTGGLGRSGSFLDGISALFS